MYTRPSGGDSPSWFSPCHSEPLPLLTPAVPIIYQALRVAWVSTPAEAGPGLARADWPCLCYVAWPGDMEAPFRGILDRPRFHAIASVLWQISCLCHLPDDSCDRTYLGTGSMPFYVFRGGLRSPFLSFCVQ